MRKLNIFADCHHFGLFNSLKLLFEDRLGGELYRPIGEEWLTAGYWKMAEIYNNHPATVAQYLGINDTHHAIEPGYYTVRDTGHNYYQRAITLDYFMSHNFDYVIASIPQHVESFAKLAADHPNHPKTIYQVGNQWNISIDSPIKNILSSALIHNRPAGFNIVEYHQEFDLNIFKPDFDYSPANNISSFVNCFNTAEIYRFDWAQFLEVEQSMPGWSLRSYGGSCRDGNANGQAEVARMMRESRFVWHVKYDGDGYGHVIHNAAAVGRPAIVKRRYYTGKMAESLMIDGVTCIAIDELSTNEIINKINYHNDDQRYLDMCRATYRNFMSIVDFDTETKRIFGFLESCI